MTRIMFLCLAVASLAGCDDGLTREERAARWQAFSRWSNAYVDQQQRALDRLPDNPAPPIYMPPPPQPMTQCRWNGPVWQCQ